MSYDARIRQMQDIGVLTGDQAERLARATAPYRPDEAPARPRRKRWWAAVAFAAALACLVFLLAVLLPGGDPAAPVQDVSQTLNQPEEIGRMSKSLTGGLSLLLIIALPLAAVLIWIVWLHNSLVTKEEAVFASWAQVESNYQRRADLIPNIVESVSDYMKYESETLGGVVKERATATGGASAETLDELNAILKEITTAQEESSEIIEGIEGAPDSEALLERLAQAQDVLGSAMHRVVALSENYPELRSSDQVLALQAELEGTENRINVARIRFNEEAFAFNAAIRRMPASIVASAGNFRRKAYFKSHAGAGTPVAVDLD